jgi:hypothetical protein
MADGSYIHLEVYWTQLKLLSPDTMDPNKLPARAPTHGPIAYSRPAPRPFRRLRPLETPMPGAHLITPWMGFAHHGIYVGEGKVIHYGALVYDLIRKPVEEVTLAAFCGGRPIFVVQQDEGPFEVADIIARARSRLGESRYRLLSNNCEHFVEWCLYGEHRSFQVQRALEFPRFMGECIQSAIVRMASRLLGLRKHTLRLRNRPRH